MFLKEVWEIEPDDLTFGNADFSVDQESIYCAPEAEDEAVELVFGSIAENVVCREDGDVGAFSGLKASEILRASEIASATHRRDVERLLRCERIGATGDAGDEEGLPCLIEHVPGVVRGAAIHPEADIGSGGL